LPPSIVLDGPAWCPPGEFEMGSAQVHHPSTEGEAPRHPVRLTRGFWIGRTPVTTCVRQTASGLDQTLAARADDDLPDEGISWNTAVTLCSKMTSLLQANGALLPLQRISLPTVTTRSTSIDMRGTRDNSDGHPDPVGLKRPNPWGIHDLYGNVMECCLDDFYSHGPAASVDPCFIHGEAARRLKIARGGSYSDRVQSCRSAYRRSILQDNPFGEELGFRVVCVES
jgi:formylglycine-generating enzyme required for sulfatase activity